MAEEYCGGVNWWDTSSTNRSRFNGGSGGGGGSSSMSTTTTLANSRGGRYGWLTEAPTTVDINSVRSSLDSVPPPKMEGSSLLVNLGLSSQAMDWNQQPLLRNPEKAENSLRSMLQEGIGLNTNFHHDTSGGAMFGSSDSIVTCQGLTDTSFQLDSTSSTSGYCNNPSSILQGLIGSDQQNQHQTTMNYQQNYFGMAVSNDNQQPHELHFTNNAPYWNASASAQSMTDIRPNFFSPLQTQLPIPMFDEKPMGLHNTLEMRDMSLTTKKSSTESNNKRVRNEGCANSSTMPPFKVRKEKMGDRITALQQLVSPFGKTDTASVLSEAIEYIKFLHEQVSVLSTPYLKCGASYQHHQPSNDKAKIDANGTNQDLRSRGLCLVPVSSTFPMTHETTVDFWTPTFGGTFR